MANKKMGRPLKADRAEFIQIRFPKGDRASLERLTEILNTEKGVPVSMTQAAALAVREALERRVKR